MPEERYPHLFLPGPTETRGFTSVNQGGSSQRLPIRSSRSSHAASLEAKLIHAWNHAGGQQAASVNTRRGCYVEFRSAPDSDLALTSLETRRSGIRLCKVSQVEASDGRTESRALVFIPADKRSHFINRFRRYGQEIQEGRTNPNNQPLVAPIEDIVAAVLRDFWTDESSRLPGENADWIEVWISANGEDGVNSFRETLRNTGVEEHPDQPMLMFPERAVMLVRANAAQLGALIEASDLICELRSAREIPTHIMDWDNKDQADLCQHLVERLRLPEGDDIAVCILDTGVNNGHPLLRPILADEDLHSVKPEWGQHDSGGHGTLMAGLAAFGDLQPALESNEPIAIRHVLESSKILPPSEENPKHLWGDVTKQGASRVEIQQAQRKRIFVLPVTSSETRNAGHPTSWSAALDEMASGSDGSRKRLIIVSAGNVKEGYENYPTENMTNEIHDPAQAWNVLSVGAHTQKWQITTSGYEGHRPIAAPGQLSPYSTTSHLWDDGLWPVKPEILMEGGNRAISPDGTSSDPEDLRLISTCMDFRRAHFWPFEATSAASAQAAWMAAQIQAVYPELWPETLRGLIVHSARWTEAMIKQFFHGDTEKRRWRNLVRVCGYGVPDLNRAISCVSNSLTLIAEGEIQPFERREGRERTKDMDVYELPWPTDELLNLGETSLQMRVTLSYFIEPGPGEIGWKDRYRYASHGLRFELNSPGETREVFVRRINAEARDRENGRPDSRSPSSHWQIGSCRNQGSIHSDIWQGRAADLATSNLIAIRPVIGWWRERHHLGRVDSRTRYALIISVETPGIESNIYASVAAKIGISTPVHIEIPV